MPSTRSKPSGLPQCSAIWDGERWVVDADAIDNAAKKLLDDRIRCRDRKRAIRAALEIQKPRLFTDQTKLTD